MSSCKNCCSKSLFRDDVSGNLICSSCGIVQEFDNYEAQICGINGPQGTFVRVGTSGSGGVLNYKDKKIFEAQKIIEDVTFRLGLSPSKSNDVRLLVSTITKGEYGLGDWFPILVGACAYVSMRKDNIPLPMSEVASTIECDVHELGRMVLRVVDFLDLKGPEFPVFNIVGSLERVTRNSPSFSRVEADTMERMIKQGIFLLQCAMKWFLTTGRQPLPMVAAVLVLVSELNEVKVSIDNVAMEVHANVSTSKKRYKELLQALVEVGKKLPWGKDITTKNIVKNAPFVIQYMELKSMANAGAKGKNLENVGIDLQDAVNECLRKDFEYGGEVNNLEDDSQYFELQSNSRFDESIGDYFELRSNSRFDESTGDYRNKLSISHECLSLIYNKFLNEMDHLRSSGGIVEVYGRKQGRKAGFHFGTEWWEGKSELSKKLLLQQLLETDVGLNGIPPSFVSSCNAYKTRKEKINAANMRIRRIMVPSNATSGNSSTVKKRKRKGANGIEWEDIIIETLLLHGVKEEEIEKGHYNVLLDLHVFNS
ncbi:plant-specific TFIIB-related protein PTF2 [Momordica charantia]|uniref:Transcription factor IIIB 50 kDa subunit n=1 Tax=Momordica charantia TaxID=3673 RepID=A0A6J1DRQ4_MOMCH|nr:plant-specific TFIIB-related protein PTF2 [Momordica charantia]XP_022156844.1 plant-specific TFIIB-related protein PTF2 [Momordica charantia]